MVSPRTGSGPNSKSSLPSERPKTCTKRKIRRSTATGARHEYFALLGFGIGVDGVVGPKSRRIGTETDVGCHASASATSDAEARRGHAARHCRASLEMPLPCCESAGHQPALARKALAAHTGGDTRNEARAALNGVLHLAGSPRRAAFLETAFVARLTRCRSAMALAGNLAVRAGGTIHPGLSCPSI